MFYFQLKTYQDYNMSTHFIAVGKPMLNNVMNQKDKAYQTYLTHLKLSLKLGSSYIICPANWPDSRFIRSESFHAFRHFSLDFWQDCFYSGDNGRLPCEYIISNSVKVF